MSRHWRKRRLSDSWITTNGFFARLKRGWHKLRGARLLLIKKSALALKPRNSGRRRLGFKPGEAHHHHEVVRDRESTVNLGVRYRLAVARALVGYSGDALLGGHSG